VAGSNGAPVARDPLSFLPGVAEKLGRYVCALRDPRSGAVFYVGNGKGERVYQHAKHARKIAGETGKLLKLDTIREIHGAGLEVGVEIIRHRIPSGEVAYEVEAAVIDTLALAGVELTNLVAGHDGERGWLPLEDIVVHYAADPVEIAPEHRVALIRISRAFRRTRTPDELYEATRKWWGVAPKRHHPQYAFSVDDGIVRAVYRIDDWERDPGGRWAFHGKLDPALDERYGWKRVSSYLRPGSQNPIKYVHC
jgi:hypothetical protein